MYEFECAFCGITVIADGNKRKRKFCSYSCNAKAARGMKYFPIDLSYDWERVGGKNQNLWKCRYNDGVTCVDRNCLKCGFNPTVAERRIREIRKRMEEEDGAERIAEAAGGA